MNNLEIRMGFESPDNGNPHQLNHFFGFIKSAFEADGNTTISESYANYTIDYMTFVKYTVLCGDQCRTGRFMTIQKLGRGKLELYEVFLFPYPGNTAVIFDI